MAKIKTEAAPASGYLTDSLCHLKVTRLTQDLPTSYNNYTIEYGFVKTKHIGQITKL